MHWERTGSEKGAELAVVFSDALAHSISEADLIVNVDVCHICPVEGRVNGGVGDRGQRPCGSMAGKRTAHGPPVFEE